MPAAVHRALEKQAARKGLKGERRDAYIYGTLAKWKKEHDHKAR